jgi:hypothetical protein
MRQYIWIALLVALALLAPKAIVLLLRGGDASQGVGIGFMIGACLSMLDRELAARKKHKPVETPE